MINITIPELQDKFRIQKLVNGQASIKACTELSDETFESSELVIPSRIDELEITEVAEKALCGVKTRKVRFPESVNRIGKKLFEKNETIQEVVFVGPIAYIPDSAFHACKNLKCVESQGRRIGGPLRQTGEDALPLIIGEHAFEGCESMTSLYLNNVVLGSRSFYSAGLQKVILRKVASIPSECFRSCTQLKEADIQGTVTLEYGAFHYCNDLTDLHVSEELYSLSKLAFDGCSKLKRIHLHNVKNPSRIKRILKPALNSDCEYIVEE